VKWGKPSNGKSPGRQTNSNLATHMSKLNQFWKNLVRWQRILCYITSTGKGEVGDQPTPSLYWVLQDSWKMHHRLLTVQR